MRSPEETARMMAGFGMRTTPGPMGPTVRYRVIARPPGDDRPTGQDARMAVDGVDSALRFCRRIEMTPEGLVVRPMHSHGRDHGPTYLFPDVDLPPMLHGRALYDVDGLRGDFAVLASAPAGGLEAQVRHALLIGTATGFKGGEGTGEASASGSTGDPSDAS